MTDDYIREGDIVEIDYITEFTKEHINEGKALVIWKSFNNQPLVRKLDTKAVIWTCYEHIARVVGHIDIVGYMDRALFTEPCEDAISRADVKKYLSAPDANGDRVIYESDLDLLPSVTPNEKIGYCKDCKWWKDNDGVYRRGIGAESKCPINCKKVYEGNGYCFMFEPQESEG